MAVNLDFANMAAREAPVWVPVKYPNSTAWATSDVQHVELSTHCKRACCTSFRDCWLSRKPLTYIMFMYVN